MAGSILTLNAWSSSLKFALFGTDAGLTTTMRGAIGELASAPHLLARDTASTVLAERCWPAGSIPPLAELLGTLLNIVAASPSDSELAAVGHHVTHGGANHETPKVVAPALMMALAKLIPLAPGTCRKQPIFITSATAPVDRKQVSRRARRTTDGISPIPAARCLVL